MSEPTTMTVTDQLHEAKDLMAEHDPDNQDDNPYERCALCGYTGHPCDVFDLAAWLIDAIEGRDNA